jgi:hypothetical protein
LRPSNGATIAIGVQDLLAKIAVARKPTYGFNYSSPWRRQALNIGLGNGLKRRCSLQQVERIRKSSVPVQCFRVIDVINQMVRSNSNGDFIVGLPIKRQPQPKRLPNRIYVYLDRRRTGSEIPMPRKIEPGEKAEIGFIAN